MEKRNKKEEKRQTKKERKKEGKITHWKKENIKIKLEKREKR